MADNYLEKKMEEHRSGADRKPLRRFTPAGTRPGVVDFELGELCVLIYGAYDSALFEAVVKSLAAAGCRVGFVCSDLKAGRALAQRTGSQHLPLELAAAREAFEKLRGRIDCEIEAEEGRLAFGGYTLSVEEGCESEAASLCRYLLLPYSRALIAPCDIKVAAGGVFR